MTSMKLPVALALSMTCAHQSGRAEAPRSHSQLVAAQMAISRRAPSRTTSAACYLKVDGIVRVDNRCSVYPMGDSGYTLNSWDGGKPKRSHFAVISVSADGMADATWNADPDDDRALDPLGRVIMKQGCWVNTRARICVRTVRPKN